MNKSLLFRKDVRTVEEFQKAIQQKTSTERILLNHWVREMEARGHKIQVEDYGIDNTGTFVPLSDNRPDFEVTINGTTYLYEVKQNEYSHRNTFKVYDLEQYIEMDARILLFYGINNDGTVNKYSRWAIIHKEAMQRMLELPHDCTESKWGFKEVVIVPQNRFSEFFKSFEFRILI